MANTFGKDILIQSRDPRGPRNFYVQEIGFTITGEKANMISLHGRSIDLFIERGPTLGPVLEVTVKNVKQAKANLRKRDAG